MMDSSVQAQVKGSGKSGIKKYSWQIIMLFLLCMQILLVLYYGDKKEGYHEDEYYSYYSTNRTAGLYEPDREWVDKETYRQEFVVQPGEGFHYSQVAMVQSWDVHPPFFYFLLHTASSFFPEVFSKWLGIGVNLIAFVINFFLLSWLTYMISEKNKKLTFLVAAVHGFNAVIISGVLFIRMYEWLTLFVLFVACLHIRAMKKNDLRFRTFLLPVMAITYLGFLTQYYYMIFLFFMASGFCIWLLWRERKLLPCFRYGVCVVTALAFAVLSYPASLSHIFRGYRGTGATTEFFNSANTKDRLSFFYGLMNDYLFDGFFLPIFLIIVFMAILLYVKRKKDKFSIGQEIVTKKWEVESPYFLLLFAVCGYFFTVSKTALLLYETSNRYQLPIYGIGMMLVIVTVYYLSNRLAVAFALSDRTKKMGLVLLFLVFLAGDMQELVSGKVLFLYEEDKGRVEYAKENADVPVIVLYNDATPYHVWWCSEELLEYDGIYFMSEANKEKITDEIICSSDKIIVYAADYETQEESLEMILKSVSGVNHYSLISQKSLWKVYEFN